MRKAIAGWFIRTGQRIYRPRVTETWDLPMSNTIVINTHGMDTASAAAALERVWRRRDLDQQRRGGFGR